MIRSERVKIFSLFCIRPIIGWKYHREIEKLSLTKKQQKRRNASKINKRLKRKNR